MSWTTSWTLAFPLLIPFIGAVVSLLAPRLGVRPAAVGIATAGVHLMASVHLAFAVMEGGVLAAGMGGWDAPVGIVLVADALSAIMVVSTALMGLVIAVYAAADINPQRSRVGWHALYLVLIGGATGVFLTGDLFNLYVWFEVMLIASLGLIVIGGTKAQLDAGVKYTALSLVVTLMFLAAVGLIHGMTGTLTMAELPARLAETDAPLASGAAAMLMFVALAAKAGLFPLWFWLPAAHHTPPSAVKAIFAATLTKSGMYAVMRVFTLIFPDSGAEALLMPVAILTMALGVILAAAQTEIHRVLSAHILSQIGYVALGLAIASPLALMGAILYMLHNIVVKANLLLLAGLGYRMTGSYDLSRTGGLYAVAPLLSVLFLISAMAMAGLPPFSGFWGKLALVQAGAEASDWIAVAAILVVGLFTLYSMTKIWLNGYLKPHAAGRARPLSALPATGRVLLVAPTMALVAISLVMGLYPAPFIMAAEAGAASLLDPAPYIAAVMGETPVETAAHTPVQTPVETAMGDAP
ncbi:MAG: proton-conducting transporter membrane subunit [Pseudomonadota bacterium]